MNAYRVDPLWTAKDLADYLGVPLQTVYDWRWEHAGPQGIKVGRHLRFRQSDIMAWLEQQAA